MKSDCIEWQGTFFRNGYGSAPHKEFGTQLIHRIVYQRAHGPLSREQVVMHLCDNKACINLDHLRMGSQGENIADCISKKRDRIVGERNAQAKVSNGVPAALRCLRRTGNYFHRELAVLFGLSRHHVTNILNGVRR